MTQITFSCHCEQRRTPLPQRQWKVIRYQWNQSSFMKNPGVWSQWSLVECLACGKKGRTKAKYVDALMRLGKHEPQDFKESTKKPG